MSHEQTITVEVDGKYYNVPTVVNGKKLTNQEAIQFHLKNGSLGQPFKTQQEAVGTAKKRSKSFDTLLD